MSVVLDILISIGIGVLGILFYTLWRSKRYFLSNETRTFSLSKLIHDNIGAWIWSILIITLTSILTIAIPETADGISTFTGLELAANKASFFTFGLGLIALTKQKKNGAS